MTKKFDSIFVLLLITLFAATSFLLILIGAKQYRFVTDTMNKNYETRTTSSYLTEKIRQSDSFGAITVTTLEGVPALSITTIENDVSYITYIYYYEGALRELIVTEHSVFALSSGQKIMELQEFIPTFISNSLLCIQVTNTSSYTETLYFTIHCRTEKEAV